MIIAALAVVIAIIAIIHVEKRHDDDFDARLRSMEDEHRTLTYGKEPNQ